jgi:uncharacterized protein YcbK (DUF882 family)
LRSCLVRRRTTAGGCAAAKIIGLFTAVVGLTAAVETAPGAYADGDTRSLTLLHTHRNETATITYRRHGRFDAEGLDQLNAFLRDWRNDKTTKMDPRLFDVVWEAYRETGSRAPIQIVSAYRSPETNAMLHRRSRAVSEQSQHMLGKAMDIRMPDVEIGKLRATAMRLQHGGVGYYASEAFVHVDTGSIRAWPRMTQDQLARLFPDGKTVHLPSNGKPLPGYQTARAELLARGETVGGETVAVAQAEIGTKSLFAALFGGRDEPVGATPSPASAEAAVPTSVSAYASPEDAVRVAAPLPLRRPSELPGAFLTASADGLVRPAELETSSVLGRFLSLEAGWDTAPDKAAGVRALFVGAAKPALRKRPLRIDVAKVRPHEPEAVAIAAGPGAILDITFSNAPNSDLGLARFAGPAVRPLPVLMIADASGSGMRMARVSAD